jgi:hypothetical protein
MSNSKGSIKHASQTKFRKWAQWRKLQVDITVGLAKTNKLVGLDQS